MESGRFSHICTSIDVYSAKPRTVFPTINRLVENYPVRYIAGDGLPLSNPLGRRVGHGSQ